MQLINIYTNKLRPIEIVDKDVFPLIEKNLERFFNFYKENIPTNKFAYLDWSYPYDFPYRTYYDQLIKVYAELLGVKVMYKDQLDKHDLIAAGYSFIGDEVRIQLLNYLWDWSIGIIKSYSKINWGREEYAKNRKIASIKVKHLVSNITLVVKKLLVVDLKYEYYLEKYIQLHFKLDYKEYISIEKQYYHAISNYYHNKRMLL